MTSESEQTVDYAMEGKKPLGLMGGFESTHLPFPLARRLMRSASIRLLAQRSVV